jgi:pyruvate/2-oxoglutarate dehydrogenase complex dihydrolipoamide dehydrogenase (E3) component
LLVLGAGPIGCELAQTFRRFGSEVHLIQRGQKIIPREDPDAAAIVQRRFEREGIQLHLGVKVIRAEKSAKGKRLVGERDGRKWSQEGDAILVGVGRKANAEGLNLEAAGVAYDANSVHVDDHLRTTNGRIFAAGDICSTYKFTHAADAMARIALQNALFFGRKKLSRLVIPWCTYTDPEVARVGLTEADAQGRGISVDTFTVRLDEVDRAILDGETEGFARIHVRHGTDRIVGATVVSAHAGEMMGEITLAMTRDIGLGAIAANIHSYPTQAEAIKKLGDLYQRSRLTPRVASILRTILKWRR